MGALTVTSRQSTTASSSATLSPRRSRRALGGLEVLLSLACYCVHSAPAIRSPAHAVAVPAALLSTIAARIYSRARSREVAGNMLAFSRDTGSARWPKTAERQVERRRRAPPPFLHSLPSRGGLCRDGDCAGLTHLLWPRHSGG